MIIGIATLGNTFIHFFPVTFKFGNTFCKTNFSFDKFDKIGKLSSPFLCLLLFIYKLKIYIS
jgi:hypothetical protein